MTVHSTLSAPTALPRKAVHHAREDTPGSAGRVIDWATLFVVLLCSAWIFSLPLRSHRVLLGFAQDDFYYYLKAAQNLASGHGSTFDGTTLTNGYHPLYFLLWTCASFFIHTLRGAFRLLWLLDVVSCVAIFACSRTLFRKVTANGFLSNAFAVVMVIACVPSISYQMEVTLALPLGLAFLKVGCTEPERYTARRCTLLGLLGALTMLARLDAGILVFLFLLSLFTVRGMRRVLLRRNIASFCAGALPLLVVYFSINRHYFHQWLPISGAAKQMRHGWRPELLQVELSFAGFTLLLLTVTFLGCLGALLLRKRMRPQEKPVLVAALLMPLLFYAVEMLVSAWKLWGWYLYALRFSFFASLAVVLILVRWRAPLLQQRVWLKLTWLSPAVLLVSLLALAHTRYRIDTVMFDIANEDLALQQFAANHPGRYAMGDRAGMFGYLSASPVLQAEGLMMDANYLQHIRRGDDLLKTFQGYKVDYYVQYVANADAPERIQHGCLQAQEPSIAGRDALRMHSLLCRLPIAVLPGTEGLLYVFRLSTAV